MSESGQKHISEYQSRYHAANELLDTMIAESHTVPQPEGKAVVAAYRDGRLADPSTMLHVIALLLGR